MSAPKHPDPPGRDEDRAAWERRVACAEINGRRVNEAIERGRLPHHDDATFMCECGRLGCTDKLHLQLADYERVRSAFDRFLLAPGHEVAGVDTVVQREDGYVVAEKRGEESAALALQTDPRA
jgi:hypothetical protein